MLAAEHVTLLRGGRILAENVNFALDPGQALIVRGANGSGKSTLLRVLAGLLPPGEGRILYRGAAIDADPPAFGKAVNMLGHENGLKAELTVLQNLDFWLSLRDPLMRKDGRRKKCQAALARLGIAPIENRLVSALSFGLARRGALARLCLSDAPLWLLDEPAVGLDEAGLAALQSLAAAHLESGGMIVATTHQSLPFKPYIEIVFGGSG